jgi:hypothetical protein
MEREENNCTKYEEANDLMRAELSAEKTFSKLSTATLLPLIIAIFFEKSFEEKEEIVGKCSATGDGECLLDDLCCGRVAGG